MKQYTVIRRQYTFSEAVLDQKQFDEFIKSPNATHIGEDGKEYSSSGSDFYYLEDKYLDNENACFDRHLTDEFTDPLYAIVDGNITSHTDDYLFGDGLNWFEMDELPTIEMDEEAYLFSDPRHHRGLYQAV